MPHASSHDTNENDETEIYLVSLYTVSNIQMNNKMNITSLLSLFYDLQTCSGLKLSYVLDPERHVTIC